MISKVHHDVKKYVIASKLCHKIKSHGKYVNISKRMSYKSQNVRHVVKNYVMTSKSMLWRQKVLHNIMTSTSTSWHQNVCFNVEKYIKKLPWMVKEKIKKVRLDIKRLWAVMSYSAKVLYWSYLKCKIQFLFWFVLRILVYDRWLFGISHFWWIWPLIYTRNISRQCQYRSITI